MDIKTTSTTQLANGLLETPERTLYYLIIKNKNKDKYIINIGKKSFDNINELIKNDK